jgi:RNA polymerase sigma-70 factor (family 1)
MSPDLTVLIEEINNNNESSFRIFYTHYFPRLFRVAHFYLRNNENAEEVVMDVFIKIWNNRKKLSDITNLDNYTFTMVKNHSLNFLKKNRIASDDLEEYHTTTLIEYLEPEKLFLGKELANELQKAISNLPPRCQLIFRMVREDGMKYKEVADILNISLKAVENQLQIASKRIRPSLEIYFNEKPRKTTSMKVINKLFNIFY